MDSGIFCVETESQGSVLAIVFPIYDELSEAAKALATVNEADPAPDQEAKADCLFFTWQSACVPIFELLSPRPEWIRTGMIDKKKLINAIWRYYPEYATVYNAEVKAGENAVRAHFADTLGTGSETTHTKGSMIKMRPKAGRRFCELF